MASKVPPKAVNLLRYKMLPRIKARFSGRIGMNLLLAEQFVYRVRLSIACRTDPCNDWQVHTHLKKIIRYRMQIESFHSFIASIIACSFSFGIVIVWLGAAM